MSSSFPMVAVGDLKVHDVVMVNRHPHIIDHIVDGDYLAEPSLLLLTDADGDRKTASLPYGEAIKHLDTWTYQDWAAYVLL